MHIVCSSATRSRYNISVLYRELYIWMYTFLFSKDAQDVWFKEKLPTYHTNSNATHPPNVKVMHYKDCFKSSLKSSDCNWHITANAYDRKSF